MRAAGKHGEHISGAEGIFHETDVQKVVGDYSKRALEHSRGRPDNIVLTAEKLKRKPVGIISLPLATVSCGSPADADSIAKMILARLGVSEKAAANALGILRKGETMRGASLMDATSGLRLEPDKQRGVRASRMGITKNALAGLSRRLARRGINTSTVKEALVVASKVASARGVLAELCISDDPHYTTGYLASTKLGYLRVPNIKKTGSRHGGRVFFVESGASVQSVISYVERTPVLVNKISEIKGTVSPDDIFRSHNR